MFAKEKIEGNSVIGFYSGEYITESEALNLEKATQGTKDYRDKSFIFYLPENKM